MTKFFASIGVAMAVQTAFAGNITDINVSTLPDSQKIIKIRFDRDVPVRAVLLLRLQLELHLILLTLLSDCLNQYWSMPIRY